MGYLVTKPFEIFLDRDGNPLENGYLYFGTVSQNPETNPISIYWDSDLTIPAANPVRTINGYASRNGTPANLYAASNYSTTVKDKNGKLVYNRPSSAGIIGSASLISFDLTGQSVEAGATQQVNGIASLRGINPVAGRVVFSKYHTDPLDGGHGHFEALTTDGPYTDDNGITILPTGGDGSSCWRRVYSGYIYPEWYGLVADGVTNEISILNTIHDNAPIGSTVKLPGKQIGIGSEFAVTRRVNFIGEEPSINGTGTFLKCLNNTRGLVVKGTSGSRLQTPLIQDIGVTTSVVGHSNDLIAFEYCLLGDVVRPMANANSTGAGISFKECWDMTIHHPLTRGCGTPYDYTAPSGTEKGQLHFYSPSVDNNNNIKIWHPHTEHAFGNLGAQLLIEANASGQATNSIVIYGGKQENGAEGTNYAMNIIKGGSRIYFNDTLWALYSRAFVITGGTNIRLNGFTFNNSSPSSFATISGGDSISGDVIGSRPGNVISTGGIPRITLRTQDSPSNAIWPDLGTSLESRSGYNYLANVYRSFTAGHALVSSASTFLNSKITVTNSDFATIINLPISSRSRFSNGITLWAKLSCDAATQPVIGYSNYTGGSDTTLVARTVTTTPTWFAFPAPPDACTNAGAFLKLATGAMGGGAVTLHEFYIEQQWEDSAMPSRGTWEIGGRVVNTSVSVAGGAGSQYTINGWLRITNGAAHVLNTDWVQIRTLTGT